MEGPGQTEICAIDLLQHYGKQKPCTYECNTRHKVTLFETDGKAVRPHLLFRKKQI